MNIKKLLIGNFFLTFIWFFAKLFITFAPSNNKNDTNKIGFHALVAAYTYQNLRGLLYRWSETETKQFLTPQKWARTT